MSPKRQIDFIGIGAPRSASTWLSQCLYEHPQISFPTKPPLSQPVQDKLYQYYKKNTNQLEKLINTDLSSWKNV